MAFEKPHFTIRASASRLDKGLLAIPQRFKDWFPDNRRQIRVVFDDENTARALTFHPFDPISKENRIFGLAPWYARRGVREGDAISITVEDPDSRTYRIALERYVREREEQTARELLLTALTDAEANQGLSALSRLTRKRTRELAREELARMAQASVRRPRPKAPPGATERHEGAPSGIRVLLRELHDGKCQLCCFSFEKRNGEPYFEIHHLDPEIGHHPTNLLVVCPNCHAQLEHASVTELRWTGDWLVGVTINGRRISIRQPLGHDSIRRMLAGLVLAAVASRAGRKLLR